MTNEDDEIAQAFSAMAAQWERGPRMIARPQEQWDALRAENERLRAALEGLKDHVAAHMEFTRSEVGYRAVDHELGVLMVAAEDALGHRRRR